MLHLTRLFPRIRVQLGEKPTVADIVAKGFDFKLTAEILERISTNCQVGDYLTAYPATDEQGNIIGLNLKLRKLEGNNI